MLSTKSNDYDLTGREKKVLELYDQGKSTRDIAKELRMSLRDISIILRKCQVNHGIPIMDNDINNNNSNNNNKSRNEKATQAIQQKGLLQPILVRKVVEEGEGCFEIVAGNRRLHACKTLGSNKIACHIIELDDKQAFEVSLIENLQTKTLGPLDEANAFKAYVSDFGPVKLAT